MSVLSLRKTNMISATRRNADKAIIGIVIYPKVVKLRFTQETLIPAVEHGAAMKPN